MIVRRPSSNFTASSTASSYCSSIKTPSALSDDWNAAEEEIMSHEEHFSTKPLSVTIPHVGPFCPRRPNLREILANTSPPPWTLTAFMAYLSNNHCLETLEFTMDAGRYKKHYAKMNSKASTEADGLAPAKDRQYVQDLWVRLVDAYIRPNGNREVNLPANVRDSILDVPTSGLPPAPENLDAAVAKVYELMEDSVLVPFLNSAYADGAYTSASSAPSVISDDGASTYSGRTHASATSFSRRAKPVRNSEPPQSAAEHYHQSYSTPALSFRKSAPSPLMHSSNKYRFSSKLTTSTSSPAAPMSRTGIAEVIDPEATAPVYASGIEKMPAMTDDSGSANSPLGDSPATPPMSSPASDTSPKRDSGMWKKLGRLSGMKAGKKKSHAGLRTQDE